MYGRIRGRKSRNERIPTNKALNADQEAELVRWINVLDNSGAPPNASQIQSAANTMFVRDASHSTPLYKNWVYNFLRRITRHYQNHQTVQKPKEAKRMAAKQTSLITASITNSPSPDISKMIRSTHELDREIAQSIFDDPETLRTRSRLICEGWHCQAEDATQMAQDWYHTFIRNKPNNLPSTKRQTIMGGPITSGHANRMMTKRAGKEMAAKQKKTAKEVARQRALDEDDVTLWWR